MAWMEWQNQGQAPDYRFSLANERTFLAWIRTALAVLAGGILLHQFATRIEPRWALLALSAGLAVLSALLGAGAYAHWRDNEIAMRHARPLPLSRLIPLLSFAVLVMSVVAAILLLQ